MGLMGKIFSGTNFFALAIAVALTFLIADWADFPAGVQVVMLFILIFAVVLGILKFISWGRKKWGK